MPIKIGKKTFSGSSRIFDGNLADAIRGLAQYDAAGIAKAIADMTDNSTGASGGNVAAALAVPMAFTSAGTDAAPKAGTDTALTALRSAITTVATSALAINNAIGMDAFTISTGGTNGAGTVAALTKTVTAVAGSAGTGCGYATTAALLTQYRTELARLVKVVNVIAVGVGLTPITNSVGPDTGSNNNFAALGVDTGTAATAPQAAASGTVSKAAMDTFLTGAANTIATCVAKLNAATSDARVITPFTVAVA